LYGNNYFLVESINFFVESIIFFVESIIDLEVSETVVVTLSVLTTVVESVVFVEPDPPQAAKAPIAAIVNNFLMCKFLGK